MEKNRVIIRKCRDYDNSVIEGIIKETMEDLNCKPQGKILIKPNIVTANRHYIHHAYTAHEMISSMVHVLRTYYNQEKITIGESGGIGIPTRMFFYESHYTSFAKKLGVPLVDFNEEETKKVNLKKAKLHKTLEVAKSLYEADFKIWMPKLKYHIVTQITNALKLNIGIITHKERFLYHDDRLHEKIVDCLEIGYPDLIVTDAITIGRGFESSPFPEQLGAIIISTNPLAIDVVASHILNYRPEDIRYMTEARDRGYGSIKLDDVDVSGDVSIEELAAVTSKLYSPFQNLQELDTPLKFYEGTNRDSKNICYGGCICSIKGCLGTADRRYKDNLKNAKNAAIVMGYYEGDVIHPDETVALIGSCAGVSGRLEAKKLIRIKGCPVKVADLMIWILPRLGVKSPAHDPRNAFLLIFFSIIKFFMRLTIPLRKKSQLTG